MPPRGPVPLCTGAPRLAGLPPYAKNEGRSLRPLLEGTGENPGHVAITSYGFGNHAIRDERYRYIYFIDGSEELYDHQQDPDEWYNVADEPAYAQIKQRLKGHLPAVNAPLSPVHSGSRVVNDHFAEMYEKAGLEVRR